MSASKFDRFLPIAGVLVGLLFVAVNALTWGSPDSTDAAELAAWGSSHETRVMIAGFAMAYIAVLMAFFAVALRGAIRAGEAEESTYSSVAFAGGLMVSIASALWSYVSLTTLSAVTDGDAAAVSADGALQLAELAALADRLRGALPVGRHRRAADRRPAAVARGRHDRARRPVPDRRRWDRRLPGQPVWLIVTGVVLHQRLSAGAPGRAASTAPAAPSVHV